MEEIWHGTSTGYSNHKCRCDLCSTYQKNYDKARRTRLKNAEIVGDEYWHGTPNGYNTYNCRCYSCSQAHKKFREEYRIKRIESITGDEDWHGTERGYRIGCRCDGCKSGRSIAKKEYTKKLIENTDGSEDWHGTVGGYSYHACRCQPCKDSNKEYTTTKEYTLRRRALLYGLSIDEIQNLESLGCSICGTFEPGRKGWCIDHDHSCCPGTKTCGSCVRGVLCVTCNFALGAFKDDPKLLNRAIEYLASNLTNGNI